MAQARRRPHHRRSSAQLPRSPTAALGVKRPGTTSLVPVLALEDAVHHLKQYSGSRLLVLVEFLVDLGEGFHLDTGHLRLYVGIALYQFVDLVLALAGSNSLPNRLPALGRLVAQR